MSSCISFGGQRKGHERFPDLMKFEENYDDLMNSIGGQ